AREQPTRNVTLSAFRIDAKEVTNAQLARWLNTAPGLSIKSDRFVFAGDVLWLDLHPQQGGILRQGSRFEAPKGRENKPPVQLSGPAALAYCKSRRGELPTEAQWEYVARSGRHRFPWGEQAPRCSDVAFGRGMGMPCASLAQGPADVGS